MPRNLMFHREARNSGSQGQSLTGPEQIVDAVLSNPVGMGAMFGFLRRGQW